jgi:hypothetical protein
MYYVYLIESLAAQGQRYVGMTADLKKRLQEHNEGKVPSYVKIQAMEANYLYRIHRSGQGRRFRAQSQIWIRSCICQQAPMVITALIPAGTRNRPVLGPESRLLRRKNCQTRAAHRIPSTAAHITSDK